MATIFQLQQGHVGNQVSALPVLIVCKLGRLVGSGIDFSDEKSRVGLASVDFNEVMQHKNNVSSHNLMFISTDTVLEFHAEAPQATESEGLPPKALHDGKSGIRTHNLSDERRRIYQ